MTGGGEEAGGKKSGGKAPGGKRRGGGGKPPRPEKSMQKSEGNEGHFTSWMEKSADNSNFDM